MSTEQITNLDSDKWIAAHPEVTAAAPPWADKIEAEADLDGRYVSVSYDRVCGAVEIGIAATWDNGTITVSDPAPAYLYFRENETGVTAEKLRQFAAEFAAAADAMEGVGA